MLELIALCTVDVTLAEPIVVGAGPAGLRLVYEVTEATMSGDRINGKAKGNAGADWVVVSGAVGTLDVRATFETDDGAVVFVHYSGRVDASGGPGTAPIYVAPLFETGDERYAWLNLVQAVGKGTLDGTRLHYEWYEVR